MGNIWKFINVFSLVLKAVDFFKKKKPEEVKLTKTDKLIDASDIAERIRRDMEICGYTVLSMLDDEDFERIDDVFTEHFKQDEDQFKQMVEFVRKANFNWSCYADHLKILAYGDVMPKEIKDDLIKHKPKKKKSISKRKLKKIHQKHTEEEQQGEVVNKVGLEAISKLAKDIEKAKEKKAKEKNDG